MEIKFTDRVVTIGDYDYRRGVSYAIGIPPLPKGSYILIEDPDAAYCVGDGERYGEADVWRRQYLPIDEDGNPAEPWLPCDDKDLQFLAEVLKSWGFV